MVAETLNHMGIKAQVHRITDTPPKGGVQAWARKHRYQALVNHALPDDAVIMTAHHAGDQIETVAMRLERGSGLRGLAGMKPLTRVDGLRIARPFLSVSRDELHQVLADGIVPVVDDPSNRNRKFTRVRFREDMQALEDAGAGPTALKRLGELAGRIDQAFERSIDQAIAGRACLELGGWGWFQRDLLSDLPFRAGLAFLARMYREMRAAGTPPREDQLARLRARLMKGDSVTLGGCEWRPWGTAWFVLCREAERSLQPIEFMSENGTPRHGIFDGRWHVVAPCPGRVQALGAKGYAALRRALPEFSDKDYVPARAFWSMPVFIPDTGISDIPADMGLLTLDDHGIIPHLIFKRNDLYSFRKTGLYAGFIGGMA